MVNGIAATTDDGSVKAVLTYEDDAGNQTRQEIDMQLYVSEPMIDDGSDMMIPEEEPQKTSNIGMIIGIIAAVAAGIVVVVVVVKLRKKKKAAKLLQEDLLDLNQKDDQQ